MTEKQLAKVCLDALDQMGLVLVDDHHVWSPKLRTAYETATAACKEAIGRKDNVRTEAKRRRVAERLRTPSPRSLEQMGLGYLRNQPDIRVERI